MNRSRGILSVVAVTAAFSMTACSGDGDATTSVATATSTTTSLPSTQTTTTAVPTPTTTTALPPTQTSTAATSTIGPTVEPTLTRPTPTPPKTPATTPSNTAQADEFSVLGTVSSVDGGCVLFTPGDMAESWSLSGDTAGLATGSQVTLTGRLTGVDDARCGGAKGFVVTGYYQE